MVYLPLCTDWNLIFSLFLSVGKIFYILYMITVILFTVCKRHIFSQVNVFAFSRLKTNKQTKNE